MRDEHKEMAARIFKVAVEDVTEEQRQVGKVFNTARLYGAKSIRGEVDLTGEGTRWAVVSAIDPIVSQELVDKLKSLPGVKFGPRKDYLTLGYSELEVRVLAERVVDA